MEKKDKCFFDKTTFMNKSKFSYISLHMFWCSKHTSDFQPAGANGAIPFIIILIQCVDENQCVS